MLEMIEIVVCAKFVSDKTFKQFSALNSAAAEATDNVDVDRGDGNDPDVVEELPDRPGVITKARNNIILV